MGDNFEADLEAFFSRKRKNETRKEVDQQVDNPKRKKLLTENYIKTLFMEGQYSDVTICVLGEEFNLHKVLLCQSPYFSSMFNGSWVEQNQRMINMSVVDPLVTLQSLQVVFSSFYNNEIRIEPTEVVSILATAMMFQLEGLIEQCVEVMIEAIHPRTILTYYKTACEYGNEKLKLECFRWLLTNLIPFYTKNAIAYFKKIPINVMTKLVKHSELIVDKTDFSVYTMLKCWVYLRANPDNNERSFEDLSNNSNNYFSSNTEEMPFLSTSDGEQYVPVFEGLRLQNMILHDTDLKAILSENIIPKAWIHPIVLKNYTDALMINQLSKVKVKDPADVCVETFLAKSARYSQVLSGKVIKKENALPMLDIFYFGVNLMITVIGSLVYIGRKDQLLNFQGPITIIIRVKITKVNKKGQILYAKESNPMKVKLKELDEKRIMTFDNYVTYPYTISANILFVTPDMEAPVEENREIVAQS